MSTEKFLEQRQIVVAQQWVDEIAKIRPEAKGKTVVGVAATENFAEVLIRFKDGTETDVSGFAATRILSGRMIMDKPLKERQIETAQAIVDFIGRPEHKGKKVADVEATENANEVIIRFSDWTTTKVVGLFAQKILEGRTVVL